MLTVWGTYNISDKLMSVNADVFDRMEDIYFLIQLDLLNQVHHGTQYSTPCSSIPTICIIHYELLIMPACKLYIAFILESWIIIRFDDGDLKSWVYSFSLCSEQVIGSAYIPSWFRTCCFFFPHRMFECCLLDFHAVCV